MGKERSIVSMATKGACSLAYFFSHLPTGVKTDSIRSSGDNFSNPPGEKGDWAQAQRPRAQLTLLFVLSE
jgi:hypothetical protein